MGSIFFRGEKPEKPGIWLLRYINERICWWFPTQWRDEDDDDDDDDDEDDDDDDDDPNWLLFQVACNYHPMIRDFFVSNWGFVPETMLGC